MKPNKPHHWSITLYGCAAPNGPRHAISEFVGDIEGALGAADELESEVDFEVHDFHIKRLRPAKGAAK